MRNEFESKRSSYFSILNKRIENKNNKIKEKFDLYKKNSEESLSKDYKEKVKNNSPKNKN